MSEHSATQGEYSLYEVIIYNRLIGAGLNAAAACGILANLYAESGFNPKNMQDEYEYKGEYNYNDTTYTNAVDTGEMSIEEFSVDSIGYGIAQWTYKSRKASMHDYIIKMNRKSIGDLNSQVDFLLKETNSMTISITSAGKKEKISLYEYMKSIPNTAEGARSAGVKFCIEFERPAIDTSAARGNTARDLFWAHYRFYPEGTSNATTNKGKTIVTTARSCLGLPYAAGVLLDPESGKGTDSAGLVQYSYKQGANIILVANANSVLTPQNIYEYYSNYKSVSLDQVRAGDLLFYEDTESNSKEFTNIAIATDDGHSIYASKQADSIIEDETLGSPAIILRILADSETSTTVSTSTSIEHINLTNYDVHAPIVSSNFSSYLTRVSTGEDFSYGYLIDLVHGESFRFYIPEFVETAGALYNSIEITGRSVEIKAYNYTKSRSIPITLELYAGAGLYDNPSDEDIVGTLHKDANFIKSLEYPDYDTNAIILPPPSVQLILGNINMVGIIEGVSINHLKPIDEKNRSMYLKVSFTFTQTAINPPGYQDIRNGVYNLQTTGSVSAIYDEDTNVPLYEAPTGSASRPLPTNRVVSQQMEVV